MTSTETLELDTRGTICPEPVLMLGRAVKAHSRRPLTVHVVADDPTTVHDVPAWCRMTGATLVSHSAADELQEFVIAVTK